MTQWDVTCPLYLPCRSCRVGCDVVYTHTHTGTHTRAHTHTQTYTHTHTHTHTHTSIMFVLRPYVLAATFYAYIHVYMYGYVCVHMHTYKRTHTHTHAHTHTHILLRQDVCAFSEVCVSHVPSHIWTHYIPRTAFNCLCAECPHRVATISRLLRIISLFCRIYFFFIGLFCKRDLQF